jgi:branched-chain amino acid transport system substrate-binding protein
MAMNRANGRDRTHIDGARRKVVKLMAAGAAGLITSPWVFQAARSAGRPVKIGMISRQTGAIASFAEADRFVLAGANKALEPGLTIAGENHPIQIIYKDSQSNPNRASELAAQLIDNEHVDLMLASASSETCNPVSDQCELKGVPCITTTEVWQSWFFPRKGDPKTGFEWTYHFNWGFDMAAGLFVEMWQSLPTNKTIGTMFTNDPDGMAANDPQLGLPAFFKSKGFDVHNVGLYPPLSDDFTAQISELKKADCDIVCGIFNPPQFAIFWTQCAQQNYRPKIVTPLKALLSPRRSRHSAIAAWACRPKCGGRIIIRSNRGSRAKRRSSSATPMRRQPASNGRSRSASSTPIWKSRSMCSSARKSSSRRRSAMRSRRPITIH